MPTQTSFRFQNTFTYISQFLVMEGDERFAFYRRVS